MKKYVWVVVSCLGCLTEDVQVEAVFTDAKMANKYVTEELKGIWRVEVGEKWPGLNDAREYLGERGFNVWKQKLPLEGFNAKLD